MRTEEEVLKDFEKLGWKVVNNSNAILLLSMNDYEIDIRKYGKKYTLSNWDYIDMQEHSLLTELFTIWKWL